MPVYRESIQQFLTPQLTIRVWRELNDGHPVMAHHDDDILEMLRNIHHSHEEVAQRLLDMERVNAVEVKDQAGNGCVFYRVESVYEAGGRLVKVI